MPLDPNALKSSLVAAFAAAESSSKAPGATPAAVQDALALQMATAIHTFMLGAQVNPGIPVATAGSPTSQTGSTVGPGTIS